MRNNFIKKTLKNGVKLYLYIDKSMKRTFVSYNINYGSSGEYNDFYLDKDKYHVLPGCAHFLEHLLGEHSKYGNIYEKFAKKKYTKNGETSSNYTSYYFIGIEDIKKSIKELITTVDNPIFTNEDIKETSKAICEETKIARDNKYRVAKSIVDRNLFKKIDLTPKELISIGDEKTTKMIDYKMLTTCYNAFYNDDNKILIIAGNIDEKEITDYLEKIYKTIPKHPNKMKPYNYKLGGIRKKEQIEYMSTNEDYILIGFRSKVKNFTQKEIATFTYFILRNKFGTDKKFIETLKKEEIISKIETTTYDTIQDEVCIYIGVSSKQYKKFIKLLKKEIKINNFTAKDFELYKKTLISDEAFKIDYKYQTLKNFIFNIKFSDDFDDIDFIKTLTFEKFQKFYKSLKFNKSTIAIIRKK